MSTDQSGIFSGIATGVSATSTKGACTIQRFFQITGVNGANDLFSLPWDAANMTMRVIVTTPGAATASNSYTVKKVGVAADVMKISAIGSAAGSFGTFTTTSASLIAWPGGTQPNALGSQDPIAYKVSAIAADNAVRGNVLVTYARTGGSTDGYM